MTELRNKIAGCMYGLLVGDALGCPVEGMHPSSIRRTFGKIDRLIINPRRPRPLGLHSDDGQQALAVCDAVLRKPDQPGRQFAQLLIDLYDAGPKHNSLGLHRGTGRNFRETVLKLVNGAAWDSAGTVSAGNGAAMRIAPLALYFRDDFENLSNAVIDVSKVTHRDIRGIAASAAIAFIVSEQLTGRDNQMVSLSNLIDFVKSVESQSVSALGTDDHKHDFSTALRKVLSWQYDDFDETLNQIDQLCKQNTNRRSGATSGFVMGSVLVAILITIDSIDFRSAEIKAVNLGGDADTIGAMVGAMSGARYGIHSIPKEWLMDLQAFASLEDRIDALASRAEHFKPEESLIDLELYWMMQNLKIDGMADD